MFGVDVTNRRGNNERKAPGMLAGADQRLQTTLLNINLKEDLGWELGNQILTASSLFSAGAALPVGKCHTFVKGEKHLEQGFGMCLSLYL